MSEIRTRKRGDKWQYSFDGAPVGGKRTTISKSGFRTKSDALAEGRKAMEQYLRGGVVEDAKHISFADYLDLWMDLYCKVNLKGTTILNYTKKINNLIRPRLGTLKLTSINPVTLQEFINGLFREGYSRNTISVIKGILTKSLTYAVTPLRYLLQSPADYVKMPSARSEGNKKLRSSPHVYLNQEEMQKIFERFQEGSTSYIPLLIGYKCGLRIGEAFALMWKDINLEGKTLSLQRQIQWHEANKTTGASGYWYFSDPKYDSNRIIELSTDVVEALQRERVRQFEAKEFYKSAYICHYVDENRILNTEKRGELVDMLMVRQDGSYIIPRNMQHVSSIARFELSMAKFDYHSLRHTHATMLLENGAPPIYVQHRLGHKNINITLQIEQIRKPYTGHFELNDVQFECHNCKSLNSKSQKIGLWHIGQSPLFLPMNRLHEIIF